MTARVSPTLVGMCRVMIGIILLAAALGKLSDTPAFAKEIENFDMLPIGWENLAAILLPWIELVTGLALVLNIHARGGAWLAAGMMAVFTIGVIQALARGLDISCGCFGTANVMKVGGRKLIENSVFLVVALLAAFPMNAPRTARLEAEARRAS